jgi:hypothetical protein
MCPCLSSKSKYATCGRFKYGLMVPSVFERENYCLSVYELCPLFSDTLKIKDMLIKECDCELINI